jgi:cell division inhibitor SepF
MGIFDKFNEMLKGNDSYIDEEENFATGDEGAEEAFETKQAAPAPAPKSTGVGSTAALEMKVVKPERMDSAFGIGDHLMQKRTVVLNFEDTNKETVRRILDFLGGVVFAIEGNIKKVSESTYIVTPKHVDVTADAAPQTEAPKSRELF